MISVTNIKVGDDLISTGSRKTRVKVLVVYNGYLFVQDKEDNKCFTLNTHDLTWWEKFVPPPKVQYLWVIKYKTPGYPNGWFKCYIDTEFSKFMEGVECSYFYQCQQVTFTE